MPRACCYYFCFFLMNECKAVLDGNHYHDENKLCRLKVKGITNIMCIRYGIRLLTVRWRILSERLYFYFLVVTGVFLQKKENKKKKKGSLSLRKVPPKSITIHKKQIVLRWYNNLNLWLTYQYRSETATG